MWEKRYRTAFLNQQSAGRRKVIPAGAEGHLSGWFGGAGIAGPIVLVLGADAKKARHGRRCRHLESRGSTGEWCCKTRRLRRGRRLVEGNTPLFAEGMRWLSLSEGRGLTLSSTFRYDRNVAGGSFRSRGACDPDVPRGAREETRPIAAGGLYRQSLLQG